MDDKKISQAEEELVESLGQPQSYETDGEKISQFDPEKRLNVIERIRKSRMRNPFRAVKMCRISTQGPER